MKKITLSCFLFCLAAVGFAQSAGTGFTVVSEPSIKQVNILYNGKLLTAYCYYDSIFKPILFPINTIEGITVTRGYPIKPVAGEKTDHPHHTGMWLNYESVNGLDFWNNSTAISPAEKYKYGTIHHRKIVNMKGERNRAILNVEAQWTSQSGEVLLNETTGYVFTVRDNRFYIDRNTVLTAAEKEVVFKDVKDGFLGIRVARELEMPSTEPATYIDAHGKETTVSASNNGVTGWYVNSNGQQGDSVWGTKSRWAMLTGKKQNKDIAIAIFDKPSNTGYPAYWHARGYGLFAANPLGRKIFSNGKETLHLTLRPGQSADFHYLVMIQSGRKASPAEMNIIADDFGKN